MSRLSLSLIAPALTLLLSACDGSVASDGTTYENWAQSVSTIPLTPASNGGTAPAKEIPLKAPPKPENDNRLRVELLTPHQLWDARDGPLNVPTLQVVEVLSPAEAPVSAPQTRTTPPQASTPQTPASDASTKLIQLGAYSTEQGARQAWQRLKEASGNATLAGLQPQYQSVEVAGRQLVRLRVAASDGQARTLCQALASNDPWCQKPAE